MPDSRKYPDMVQRSLRSILSLTQFVGSSHRCSIADFCQVMGNSDSAIVNLVCSACSSLSFGICSLRLLICYYKIREKNNRVGKNGVIKLIRVPGCMLESALIGYCDVACTSITTAPDWLMSADAFAPAAEKWGEILQSVQSKECVRLISVFLSFLVLC